jgi:hypothetical protein
MLPAARRKEKPSRFPNSPACRKLPAVRRKRHPGRWMHPAARRKEKPAGFPIHRLAGSFRLRAGSVTRAAGCFWRLAGRRSRAGFSIQRLAGCFTRTGEDPSPSLPCFAGEGAPSQPWFEPAGCRRSQRNASLSWRLPLPQHGGEGRGEGERDQLAGGVRAESSRPGPLCGSVAS